MLNKMSLLLAATAVVLGAGAANAQSYRDGQSRDYNSSTVSDQDRSAYENGYNYGYDDGYARGARNAQYRSAGYIQASNRRYDRGAYYYGNDCGSNSAAGTVLGAIAGGVIGNQIGHGDARTATTVGGVILGGVVGNSLTRNLNCNDRRQAMNSYGQGFEGRVGRRYDWRSAEGSSYGSFTPTREYARNGNTCRDFREVSYRDGERYNRNGTACRQSDGNWYLD